MVSSASSPAFLVSQWWTHEKDTFGTAGKTIATKRLNLLDFVDMMCKNMLENKFCNGKQYTRGTTHSICPPPPSKKRPASDNIQHRRTGHPRDHAGGGLLNSDPLLDEDHDFEMVNDSQISDLMMDPCDFQRRSTHY